MEDIKKYGPGPPGTSEDEIPKTLFLYRKSDEFAEQIVAKQQLYFSSPLNFNDPFECSKEDAETEGKKGILCLSAVIPSHTNATLMWAHYADKHNGLCFEFDIKHNENGKCTIELKNNIENDKYVRTHVIEDVKYKIANPAQKLLAKAEAWKYEQEWRIIVDYGNTIKKNKYQRTFCFKKDYLKSIYFGVNASPNTIEKYKSLCALWINDNPHKVELYKMEKQKGMQYLFQAPTPIDY